MPVSPVMRTGMLEGASLHMVFTGSITSLEATTMPASLAGVVRWP